MIRLFLFLAFSSLLCTSGRAQGVVVDITRAGIGATPDMDCRNDLPEPDCRPFNGIQDITVAPGAEVALFLEWQNNGTADIIEVSATNEMGNPVFAPIMELLQPTQTRAITVFFNAPTEPGQHVTLVTLTAESDVPGREDTDQFRYFITVDRALPVALSDFTAVAEDKSRVRLAWTTIQEVNNDRFVIERSANGDAFQQVGAVAGANNGQERQTYTFYDQSPISGASFYRLRQVDLDGTETLSEVVTIQRSGALGVFPNPTTNDLQLTGFAGGPISIYDIVGRTRLEATVAANGKIDLSRIPPGQYFLRAGERTIRWVKR
ncbi:MAG: T9SS type A sorting domain-containing protein [Bacteroidota bacterium]